MTNKLLPKIVFKNKPEDEMLIGAYVEPLVYGDYVKKYEVKVSAKQAYDELKEANFNTLIQTHSKLNYDKNEFTYEMFEHTSRLNMNFLFRDYEVVGIDDVVTTKSEEELKEYFKNNYKELDEKYSSFAGVHYIDEPGYKDWKRAREIKSAFKSVFPEKLFFLNLLQVYAPSWAFPNGSVYSPNEKWWLPDDTDYEKYYETYIDEANPEMFCYDYYPLRYEFPFMLDQYFLQLHLSYKYSKKANVPLLSFVQNGNWDVTGRIPNDDELRWQINTALAYNTKGICYYTYWAADFDHKRMCIDENGAKTSNYYLVQQINKELLFIDEYILNFAFEGYMLIGNTPNGEVPAESERIYQFGKIKNFSGGDIFVGCFKYYKNEKCFNAYIVVNNSIKKDLDEKLYFSESIIFTKIHRDKKEVLRGENLKLKMSPGDAFIIIEEFKD